jgi:mono/diheme cytochrome c family protein
MRRIALALSLLVVIFGVLAIAACGGEEEAAPTPETVTGTTTDTTETDTTETETTGTDTTETTTTETGGAGEGDPVAGKEVFLGSAGCGTCHTLADAGTSGTVGPNLDDSKPSVDLAVDRVTNGAGAMPPFADSLSEQQIRDVATYVSQAAGG